MTRPLKNRKSYKTKITIAFCAALLLCSILGLFGPIAIFVTNSLEFSCQFRHVIWILLAVLSGLIGLGTLVLFSLPRHHDIFERSIALVYAFSVALWLQGNIMVWRYGFIDGRDVNWRALARFGWIDTPVWIGVLLIGFVLYKQWLRRWLQIFLVLLAVQLLATAIILFTRGEEPGFKSYSVSHEEQFRFSSRTNVIILVLDSTRTDVFQDAIIDTPSMLKDLNGFTYYRNSVGGFPSTYGAVSYMLTGQLYENQLPFQDFLRIAFQSECSVPKELIKNNVLVDLYPLTEKTIYFSPQTMSNLGPPEGVTYRDITYLYGLTLFRYSPHFLKQYIHQARNWVAGHKPAFPTLNLSAGGLSVPVHLEYEPSSEPAKHIPIGAYQHSDIRFAEEARMQAAIETEQSVFKFFHRMGTHAPIVLDKNLNFGVRPFTHDNYIEYVVATFQWVRIFLETLKQIQAYDNSLIIIIGDHGTSDDFSEPPHSQQSASGALRKVIMAGTPLILVKPIGSRGDFQVSDAPVTLGDIPATVFTALQLETSCRGKSIVEIKESDRRARRYFHYEWFHAAWKNEYFPPITEYIVDGFSWEESSWQTTGRVFKPAK